MRILVDRIKFGNRVPFLKSFSLWPSSRPRPPQCTRGKATMADLTHEISQQPSELDHIVTQSPDSATNYPEYHFLSQDQDISMQRPDMATFDLRCVPPSMLARHSLTRIESSSEPHLNSPMFSLMQPSHLPTPQR